MLWFQHITSHGDRWDVPTGQASSLGFTAFFPLESTTIYFLGSKCYREGKRKVTAQHTLPIYTEEL